MDNAVALAESSQSSRGVIAGSVLTLVRVSLGVLCVTTALALFARNHWLADLLANLRMQQLIGLAAVVVLAAMYRRWRVVVVAIALLALHLPSFGSAIAPSGAGLAERKSQLTITFANVLSRNTRHDEILADLTRREPDVIVILELNRRLAEKMTAALSTSHAHSLLRPDDAGNFGIGLFSKYPLGDEEIVKSDLGIESILATVTTADQDYRIIGTHPIPPMGAERFAARNSQLDQLALRVKRFRSNSPQTPVVLVGDLNLTPWSPWFTDLERTSGLVRARDSFDVTPTWYALHSFAFGLMLDHGLISSDLFCISHDVGNDIGSDHRSITLGLTTLR